MFVCDRNTSQNKHRFLEKSNNLLNASTKSTKDKTLATITKNNSCCV